MTTKAELQEQKEQLDRYLTSKHKAGDYLRPAALVDDVTHGLRADAVSASE